MIARVLSSTQGANNTMMSTSLMSLPCTQECVIVKFHHIVNMHDQFMGMNTIQQPLLSCLPAFYALAIPMSNLLRFLLLVYIYNNYIVSKQNTNTRKIIRNTRTKTDTKYTIY